MQICNRLNINGFSPYSEVEDTMKENKIDALCLLQGNKEYQNLRAIVMFKQTDKGVLLKVSLKNYPISSRIKCNQPLIAMHLHEGKSCSGTKEEPFKNALGHFNPDNCPHPYHAGDLGNLFINRDGTAFMSMLNDRFKLKEALGKTLILHANPDDFTTQPSGNSGAMIACGIIKSTHSR